MTSSGASVQVRRAALEVFDQLLAVDGAGRAAVLAALAREQPAVHAETQRLLAADRAAESQDYLSGDALSAALGAADASAPIARDGEIIGGYRLDRALGSGGMGEVWLARRLDGLSDAPVALKLLHPHLLHSIARGRFLREGRILGELAHDHVARLRDAGLRDNGQPWLAIEYVDGQRIDHWCDARQLDVAARLRLFQQVCAAVAHAHAHLVVHRDLKPSNILVTEAGSIKLLDFGIAKLLDDEAALPATELTRLGGRALTPEYAAPEQLSGASITTATDIHALGVLLYALLSGLRPYGKAGSTVSQIEHQVLEETAPPPSRTTTAIDAAERAGLRDTTPAGLRRLLRGDLDTIVAKAMKKLPQQRYPSVLALAEDLRRHLEHLPVLAQPDSRTYRARKYLRRHRLAAGTAAVVVVALVGGLGTALWQAQRAMQAAALAQQVVAFQGAMLKRVDVRQFADGWLDRMRDKLVATLNQSKPLPADEAAALLAGFDRLRPWAQPAEVARETLGDYLLTPSAKEIDQQFAGDPRTASVLRTDLAQAYADLGLPKNAETQLQQAIAEAVPVFGADSREVLAAKLQLAQAISLQGRDAEAIVIAREIAQARERQLGADHRQTLEAESWLAQFLNRHQQADEGIPLFETVLRKQQRLLGAEDTDTLRTQASLGGAYTDRGEYAKSRPLLEQALQGLRRNLRADDPKVLGVLLTLAATLDDIGDYAGAIKLDEELLDARRRTLGNEHPLTIVALVNLSAAVDNNGDKARGFGLKREAWQLARKALGADSRLALASASNYAAALQEQGHLQAAEALFRSVVEVRTRMLGADKPPTLRTLNNLGAVLAEEQHYAEAEAMQHDALGGLRKALGDSHPDVLHAWRDAALTLQSTGRDREAAAAFGQMLEAFRKAFGVDHAETLQVSAALARSMFRQGQRDAALALQQSTLDTARRTLGVRNPVTLQAQGDLAQSLHALGRDADAQTLQAQALEGLRAQYGSAAPRSIEALRRLAEIDRSLGQNDAASALQAEAQAAKLRLDAPFDPAAVDTVAATH